MLRLRATTEIVTTVWRRAILDAFVAPRRFEVSVREFWRASNRLFHSGIENMDLSNLPGSEQHIRLLASSWSIGAMPPQDLYALMRIVRWIEPATIFEIGTFTGRTTAHLALNSDARIYTLDMPREMASGIENYTSGDLSLLQPREEIGTTYRAFEESHRIHQLFGDSRTFDYTPYRGRMDLVLVDGCHLYDGVLRDSRSAFDMIRPGGVIVWHDFSNLYDVTRAVRFLAVQHSIFHVEGTSLAVHMRKAQEHKANAVKCSEAFPGPATADAAQHRDSAG